MIYEFMQNMSRLIYPCDDVYIADWIDFAYNVVGADDGLIKDLSKELNNIFNSLSYVKNNFSRDVFQKSLRFHTLSNEIVNGAMCFNAGYSMQEVKDFAYNGIIECGYVPEDENKKNTFILLKINDENNCLFAFENCSENDVKDTVMIADLAASFLGCSVADAVKTSSAFRNCAINVLDNEILINVFLKAAGTSSAVNKIIQYDTIWNVFDDIVPSKFDFKNINNDFDTEFKM